MDLDFMPSPVADRPGLLIRDPRRFSDATVIVPPLLVRALGCFDGRQTARDLRDALAATVGAADAATVADRLLKALGESGLLDDERYADMRSRREQEFRQAPTREPAHAGGGYPDDRARLDQTLAGYLAGHPAGQPADPLVGVVAPHVSPEGGPRCYGAAYRALPPGLEERTFVILGTSHYGEPNRFGLTRKSFTTPYGAAETDGALVGELARAAGEGAHVEDYCHAVEHSIEFQVLFLQHVFGPRLRILPVLCGALLANGRAAGGGARPPEKSDDAVARFIGALGEIGAREGRRLVWVLGADMTHVGRRYGDAAPARADEGDMLDVAARDRQRIDRIAAGDADGFWDLVHDRRNRSDDDDDLKWCGTSPIYTFLRAMPDARGKLLAYQQWNIDDDSVVSFAAMSFR
jgi:AmmeMemoRadiSam system protein B